MPETSSPLPEELSEQSSGLSPSIEPDHFAEPPAENVGGDIAGVEGDAPAVVEPILSREDFCRNFVGLFNFVGKRGVKSFTVTEEEGPAAEAAFSALYDTALEVTWLNFLVRPENIWLQRAFAFGGFIIPKGQAVVAEIKERRAVQSHAARPTDAVSVTAAPVHARDPETSIVTMG